MTEVPELMTERLRMRGHILEDFEVYAGIWASERSAFMGGPLDRKQAWFFFCSDIANWTLYGFGAWALERKEDGVVVGQVSIQKPDFFPEIELGWCLYEGFEGQGYAIEAARAAKAWAFGTRGLQTLVSYTHPENYRSQSICKKLGGVHDPGAPKSDPEDVVFRYPLEAA